MTSEKFANRPAATVAVAYTATDTTLEVDDASAFPADGVFRVLLGNTEGTIFRVDSVAGDVFTGAAEAFDGNAAIGVEVRIVASKEVAERFIQSPDPGAPHAPGGAAGAEFYGPLYKLVPFDDTGWSWFNQGGASFVVTAGVGFLTVPVGTGQTIRGRAKSLPGVPYVCRFLVDTIMIRDPSQAAMWGFRESATDKFLVFRLEQGNVRVSNGVTSGTVTGDVYNKNWNDNRAHQRIWLEIEYDGTDVKFRFSWDGVNFLEVLSEAKATHFTTAPDQVCFMGYDQNSLSFLCLSTISMEETF